MSGTRVPDANSGRSQSQLTEKSGAARKTSGINGKTDTQKAAKESGKVPPQKTTTLHQKAAGSAVPQKAAGGNPARLSPFSNTDTVNSLSREALAAKNLAPPAGETIPARDLFMQTAAAMGFPKDTLSTALLAFARFFSLSLNPELMGTLRRDILASGRQSSPGNAKGKAALEADALAACAALDKGVVLNDEALRYFTGFLTLPELSDHDFPSRKNGKKGDEDLDDVPEAEALKEIAEKQNPKEGFLGYMNALPGKNGQFWLVYPFKIKVRGTELRVILRLLKRVPSSQGKEEHIIADITGPKRQWRCFLEKNYKLSPKETALSLKETVLSPKEAALSRKRKAKFRADIQVFPKLSAGALAFFSKEAEHFLGDRAAGRGKTNIFGDFGGFDEILVRNGKEEASWMEDLCDERLPSINEEV